MKKYLILAAVAIVAALAVIWADRKIEQLTAERDRYAGNTAALLSDIERYRVRDSLNAARVQSLELTVKEFRPKEYQRFLIVTAETFQTCRPIIRAKIVMCKPDELENYLYDENETVVSVVKLD